MVSTERCRGFKDNSKFIVIGYQGEVHVVASPLVHLGQKCWNFVVNKTRNNEAFMC